MKRNILSVILVLLVVNYLLLACASKPPQDDGPVYDGVRQNADAAMDDIDEEGKKHKTED